MQWYEKYFGDGPVTLEIPGAEEVLFFYDLRLWPPTAEIPWSKKKKHSGEFKLYNNDDLKYFTKIKNSWNNWYKVLSYNYSNEDIHTSNLPLEYKNQQTELLLL